MPASATRNRCILHTLDGLRDGLSHFSGPSRAALVFAIRPGDPVYVYDPQNLLRGHEPIFKELFLDSDRWRTQAPDPERLTLFGQIHTERNLQLTGLISCGGRSHSIFYQMWFTEHHPDMCSIGPTERWLEHATWLLSHDFAAASSLCTEISGYVLRGYATHAVRDYIVDRMNETMGWDSRVRVYPVLDAVLGISKTREEGKWPQGKMVFVEPGRLEPVDFSARFPEEERPVLRNFKHARKLLQAVENSPRCLISDGQYVLGISGGEVSGFRLIAEFRSGYGFLGFNGETVCSFYDGSFHSSTRKANLVQLEELLIEYETDPTVRHDLYQVVSGIVHHAENEKFGCTLVIDLNPSPVDIAGQRLGRPLNLQEPSLLELAMALGKLDGAIHIGVDLKLHGFACLLDGHRVTGEDRARGARFNSALRFSAENQNVIVVVVSSDRPVSVIQDGIELNAQCELKAMTGFADPPPSLAEWIDGD
ncbi:MAG: DNA integrity scanning protein DisA nucleotide-binding domain protein [Desulfobacterales bacterium]